MAPNLMKRVNPRLLRRTTTVTDGSAPSAEVIDTFKRFIEAQSLQECLKEHSTLMRLMDMEPDRFQTFYPKLKNRLKEFVPYKYREIFSILSSKAKQKPYGGWPAENLKVLVVGAGPVGLRTAIEAQLLGAKVVIIEKREDFTRHNILKIWKYLVHDLKSLGAKKFVPKFCAGAINHIGIKTLQLFLAKVSLLLGCRLEANLSLVGLTEPGDGLGWTAELSSSTEVLSDDLTSFQMDVIVIASGKKVPLDGFNRRSLDAKLSIAVTANFVNSQSKEEAKVNQISGISKQYHQDFFKDMYSSTGIDLENIVYYRGDTHYFVMTALRKSLIDKGVILENKNDRKELLAPSNIDREKLHQFAIEAAQFSTGHFGAKLPVTDFALNARGDPDCAIFDFTNLYSARNASMVKVRGGYQLLMAIVGDSLLEPFWPEGTGCGRGVLSALDTAWLIRQWALGRMNPMEILAERENIYKLLSHTKDGGGSDLKEDFKGFTIDPSTRYRNISKKIDHEKILSLYDSDAPDEVDFVKEKFVGKQFYESKEHKTILQRIRKGIVKRKNNVVKVLRRQRASQEAS